MIWDTVISRSCFYQLYRASPSLVQITYQSDFGIDHLVTSLCRDVSWVVGKGCLLWPACSLDKTVSLCTDSFCSPRPNLSVILGTSWLPAFAFQSPVMKRTSFLVLVLEDLVGLHRTSQLQFLWYQWLEHRLGLLWCWMVCLWKQTEIILSFLQLHPKTSFQTLLLSMRATPFLLRDSCPQQYI